MRDHRSDARIALVRCVVAFVALAACAPPPPVVVLKPVGQPIVTEATPTRRATAIAAVALPPDGDWPTYNRTLAGDRYSPLNGITTANVTQLRSICSYTLPEVTALQTGPIVIGGTMYFTSDTISYAIDGGTCAEKWRTVRHSETPSILGVNRGFAYYNGTLFRGTSDVRVIALDARDGHLVWERTLDAKAPGVTVPMAPIAANGRVYVGNAGGDLAGVTGHVYALDARDGQVIWKFDVVPAAGPARATWLNPRLPPSGGGVWSSLTLDEPNGILYVPAGNPAPDFDIQLRKGDNLYTNAVIALDAATGRMLAYNQLVKRDAHDWDVDSPPALVTTVAGRAIVASANKDGLLSILDRSRVSRNVPVADLSSGLPLVSQTPTTTRLNVDVPLSRDHQTRFCPGIQGGHEWNGAAYSPQTNSLYAAAVDWCAHVQLKRDTLTVPAPGAGYWFGAENPLTDMLDPPDQAKGWVTAVDADSNVVRWKYQAARPMLAAVTPTAGGLVFAADLGGQLYAFDAATGRVLWQTNLGQSTGGGIVSYTAGGRQLLGIASGMKSPIWPGGAAQSRIIVIGIR